MQLPLGIPLSGEAASPDGQQQQMRSGLDRLDSASLDALNPHVDGHDDLKPGSPDWIRFYRGELLALVRQHLWKGNPPRAEQSRDAGILNRWLAKGIQPADAEVAIVGFALIRDEGGWPWVGPGEGCSLRALQVKLQGRQSVWSECRARYYRWLAEEAGQPGASVLGGWSMGHGGPPAGSRYAE